MCGPVQHRGFKELEDKLLGALFLLVSLPVMGIAALLIKLTSPGPVIFVQKRHGLYGKRIRVYKFRTMHGPRLRRQARAHAFHQRSPAAARWRGSPPGVTPVGWMLRVTSIDELPQLFNVIKGDMSLVGPRPHPVRLNLQYMSAVDRLAWRHCVKPGITGLAQISGARGPIRTAEDMQRRVEYDLEYIRKWSPMLDLKIIGLTFLKGIINRQS
jgi:putative colanic acid biosynthesis UDP-glucose lipid carrier transferase